jgi:hypothetical protein
MSERCFVLVDFTHMSRAGTASGSTRRAALPRAVAHAATRRALVAKERAANCKSGPRVMECRRLTSSPRLNSCQPETAGRGNSRCLVFWRV